MKELLGTLAVLVTIAGYYPYIRDIFLYKTKPHAYTWLIWAITQATALAALWYGGGAYGGGALLAGTVMVLIVFILSFKFGTKDITRGDTAALLVALGAVILWWQLDAPILAVLLVSAIDMVGFFPTLRKSYYDPYSETVSFWFIMVLAVALSIAANEEYNLLTVTYLAIIGAADFLEAMVLIVRRWQLSRV